MTETEVANLMLSHLGVGTEIGDIGTENSAEALAARRFKDVSRRATLRDFGWPFAAKITDLTLKEEEPNVEWAYSYNYPSDCLRFKRILSGTRNDTRQTRVPYKIGNETEGTVIYADKEDAQAEYTIDISDTTRCPDDFILAWSMRWAQYCAPLLTAGDPFKLTERLKALYEYELSRARASALNEEQPEEDPDAELIRARDG
jgi:hypothetical protein